MKIDPYKHKESYLRWQKKTGGRITELSPENSEIILRFLFDMQNGLNISQGSKKGPRSFIRLNNLKQRLIFLSKKFEGRFQKNLTQLTAEEVVTFFNQMQDGTIKRNDGKNYTSIRDFSNPFKTFWHWHMKISKSEGKLVQDITEYIDSSGNKPKWVYLTEEQIRHLCNYAKPEYKVMIMFLYDSGVRSPVELINLKVSDLYEDCKKLHIRDEIVKKGSFGRKINLMFSSEYLKQHIRDKNLKSEDRLFPICPPVANQYLKRLAKKTLGEKVSPAGEKYSNLTMYDFRHCSCCYWLPRYKSESALKYRFGWKKSDKIHYYSELLGMKDTITEEDMLIELDKTEIEKRLLKAEQENKILKERLNAYQVEIDKVKIALRIYLQKLNELEVLTRVSK